ncbi:hypothetical protein BG004_004922, partial [Podila humilis]
MLNDPANKSGGLVIHLRTPEPSVVKLENPEEIQSSDVWQTSLNDGRKENEYQSETQPVHQHRHLHYSRDQGPPQLQSQEPHSYHPLDTHGAYDPQAPFAGNERHALPFPKGILEDSVPVIKQEDFENSLDHLFAQQLEEYNSSHFDGARSEEGNEDEEGEGEEWKSEVMDSKKKALIEQRIARERPNRTLFVRNIENIDISEQDMRDLYSPYGDIRDVCNLIDSRGIMFISFYDIRAAEYAKKETNRLLMKSRENSWNLFVVLAASLIIVLYLMSRKFQGSLFVHVRGAGKQDVDDDELISVFSQWGEVKSIRRHKQTTHQRFIEFFDSRACASAFREGQGHPFVRGTLDLKYAWDTPRVGSKRRRSSVESRIDHRNDTYSSARGSRRRSRSRSRSRAARSRTRSRSLSRYRSRSRSPSRSRSKYDARNARKNSSDRKLEIGKNSDYRDTTSPRYEFGDKRFKNEVNRPKGFNTSTVVVSRSEGDQISIREQSVLPERNAYGASNSRPYEDATVRERQRAHDRSDEGRAFYVNDAQLKLTVKVDDRYRPPVAAQSQLVSPTVEMTPQERMEKAQKAQQ